jgi:hypothetical protein
MENRWRPLHDHAEDLALIKVIREEYAKSGYYGAMKRLVALQEEQAGRIYIDPAVIAMGYSIVGEKDLAFSWLEKAYKEKSGSLQYIKCPPNFDSLTCDPPYADLLKRIGLPQ